MKRFTVLSLLLAFAIVAAAPALAQSNAPLPGVGGAALDATQHSATEASPSPQATPRSGFSGLSPTALLITGVAVLLVVILGIVAITQPPGSTHINEDDRRL